MALLSDGAPMATYIIIPFTALLTFFAAALQPWAAVHKASPEAGLPIAIAFVALVVMIARRDELDFAPLAAGMLTLFCSGFLARWLATLVPLAAELIDLAIIHAVMLGLLASALIIQNRRRAREAIFERTAT